MKHRVTAGPAGMNEVTAFFVSGEPAALYTSEQVQHKSGSGVIKQSDYALNLSSLGDISNKIHTD